MKHAALEARLRSSIRTIPDFPQPGILFRDITPVLADRALLADVVRHIATTVEDLRVDVVAAIESRGFIIGAPLAVQLGVGFVPIRKPGKLPHQTVRIDYDLEYGTDALEAHVDAIHADQRILLVDDVLATGGTAHAALRLLQRLGGTVASAAFLLELDALAGRARLGEVPVFSLLRYE
ncbi:MAG: adenine phosphoribosyltransferase [Longimicrobiales bacterium]